MKINVAETLDQHGTLTRRGIFLVDRSIPGEHIVWARGDDAVSRRHRLLDMTPYDGQTRQRHRVPRPNASQ